MRGEMERRIIFGGGGKMKINRTTDPTIAQVFVIPSKDGEVPSCDLQVIRVNPGNKCIMMKRI